jgi:hypothetical protein
MNKKPWWMSKTMWGTLLGTAFSVAAATGHPVSPELVEGGNALIDVGLALAGGGLAAYGRVTATTAIGG